MIIRSIVFSIGFLTILCSCHYSSETSRIALKDGEKSFRVAFYNTENLFDTKDDPQTNDNDFLPQGDLKWTPERYQTKLTHLAKVIHELDVKHSLAFIGLCEVENKHVLEDLLAHAELTNRPMKSVHFNSSDKRGIDVALLYNTDFFNPHISYLCHFKKEEDPELFLREVLLVKGTLLNDTVHILVNHWPSRREGEEKTQNKRIAAAMLTQEIIDSISYSNPKASIIVMGDFNDTPSNESMNIMLQTQQGKKMPATNLMNPFKLLQEQGKGTCRFKRDWFLFDQILVSNSLTDKNGVEYLEASIFSPQWLYYKEDLQSGPFRTYVGDKYYGGYSDHFPVYIELKK